MEVMLKEVVWVLGLGCDSFKVNCVFCIIEI